MPDEPAEVEVIVVGGGAAGCVVAARLSEKASRSVLLLEAGPDLRRNVAADLRDGWVLSRDLPDWGYSAEPDDRGEGQKLRRGKLLGGTSWLTRFAVRGSPADFDAWAAFGNAGWSFDEVLPYFRKLEADGDFGNERWHGESGPIPIRRYLDLQPTEILGAAGRALEAAGFLSVEDHNRPGVVGAGRMPMNSTAGARVTTADGYLPLDGTPANLTIRPDAEVAEVVFEGVRAIGVKLVDGTVLRAGCVVLSAGTYGSPPILMRSGVGPADHLRSVGVRVRQDLPGVGSNLADHPAVDIDTGYRGPSRDATILHSIATFHSADASSDGSPDLMLWLCDPAGDPPFPFEVVLLKPHSRGTVRLRSEDPRDPPRIALPNLAEAADVDRLAEGCRRLMEVARRPEIRGLCTDQASPDLGGVEEQRRFVRENAYSVPHVVGTCAMGTQPGEGAVVDAYGRVYGTEGLFVIDASIMPDALSGFPHIVTIMMAERLSEQIWAAG
jgi:choline dehydrogenase